MIASCSFDGPKSQISFSRNDKTAAVANNRNSCGDEFEAWRRCVRTRDRTESLAQTKSTGKKSKHPFKNHKHGNGNDLVIVSGSLASRPHRHHCRRRMESGVDRAQFQRRASTEVPVPWRVSFYLLQSCYGIREQRHLRLEK